MLAVFSAVPSSVLPISKWCHHSRLAEQCAHTHQAQQNLSQLFWLIEIHRTSLMWWQFTRCESAFPRPRPHASPRTAQPKIRRIAKCERLAGSGYTNTKTHLVCIICGLDLRPGRTLNLGAHFLYHFIIFTRVFLALCVHATFAFAGVRLLMRLSEYIWLIWIWDNGLS